MKDKKTTFLKYLIPILIGIVISVGVGYYCYNTLYASRGVEAGTSAVIMAIADGLTVPGILYTGFGLLLIAAQSGIYDIFTYGFKSLVYLFTPAKRNRDEGGFYEYKVRQKEKRKAVPYHILWIGIAFIVLAIVFILML